MEGDSTGRASQQSEYPRIENWGSLFDTSLNVDARNVTKPFRAATCQRQRWSGYWAGILRGSNEGGTRAPRWGL